MSATPTRRSARVIKAPDRLAPSAPPGVTPRKRSKAAEAAPSATKSGSSAFTLPISARSKRQKTEKVKPNSRKRNAAADDEIEEDEQINTSDVESDAGDTEHEDEVSESTASESADDSETSDFEDARPRTNKTPKKTPQKRGQKQRNQYPRSAAAAPASSASRGKTKTTTSTAGRLLNDESSQLLNAILDDNVALAQVVMDWISSYREGADQAMCELINFFVKLTGCPGSVNEDALYETESIPSVLDELQKQSITALKHGGVDHVVLGVEVDGGDDLLMGRSREHRKFRKSALQFVQKLVVDGQHHLVFEEVNESNNLSAFTEVVLQWLASMAGSSYRPFRHVATLCTLTIQSALVSIRAQISTELQTTHRQLDAEQKRILSSARRNPNKESARAEQLRSRVGTLTEQDELAESAFTVFYNTVFIYRYRDVHAMIRSECLVPLASWCRAYPATYLNTEYLRYLGWSLNDKDPRVREAALSAITGPLLLGKTPQSQGNIGGGVGALAGVDTVSEESYAEGIRPFIVRFLPRLVQIAAGDIDAKVQVAALKLITHLGKHNYLDASTKIGDIRNIKKLSKPEKDAVAKAGNGHSRSKKGKHGTKRNARSREKYSHSLSQQLLEESSSESEHSSDAESEDNNSNIAAESRIADTLSIQVLYDDNNDDNDTFSSRTDRSYSARSSSNRIDNTIPLPCPHHSVMRYLAPLVAHTHASVRSAASELVSWWIKKEWMIAAQVSALGVDESLSGGVLGSADGESETDTFSAVVEDDVEMEGDSAVSIADLLESQPRKRRARKWLLFKSLGAFLWHLSRMSRPIAGTGHSDCSSKGQDNFDMESGAKKQWIMEQAASCVEEMWAAPTSSIGLTVGEDQNLALAGSIISGLVQTSLDAKIDAALGSDQSAILPRSVAAAQALWHKIPELSDLDTLSAYLSWDHTTLHSTATSKDTASSCFALAQGEETALLQAYAVWVLECNKSIADKKRRTRNKKDKSDLEEELQVMSRVWQSTFVPLLVRNIDSPDRLLPLVYLATEAMDLQAIFDADCVNVLQEVSKSITLVLERYGGDVRLARLATGFLERVDNSRLLAPASVIAATSGAQDDDNGNGNSAQHGDSTVPGDLICKAARSASMLLVTAVAAVPDTPHSHQSAYTDVYARIVALRSMIRSKDISAIITVASVGSNRNESNEGVAAVTLDSAEEYADMSVRSPDAPIEQLYLLIEQASKCIGLQTIPEKAALSALDTAYYFLLWRSLKFDKLLKQHPTFPLITSDDTQLSPYWGRVESAAKNLKNDRDRLLDLCLELVDTAALNYSRLRELAFAVLGRVLRLFTGVLTRNSARTSGGVVDATATQRAQGIRQSLFLQSPSLVRSKLISFFEHKLSDWAHTVASLSPQKASKASLDSTTQHNSETTATTVSLYKDAPSSWSIAYSRFCTIAALWAQWIGDQTVPMSCLPKMAAYTGMLGLESLEKLRVEAALRLDEHDGGSGHAKVVPKRKVGFVALSAFDHIVQAAVDNLKPMIILQGTRDAAMSVYMTAMRMSFEQNISAQPSLGLVADAVNVGTLARFVVSALKTAFAQPSAPVTPARGRRGTGDGAAFTLAPAVVGAAWAQQHLKAIEYGFSRVIDVSIFEESNNLLDENDDIIESDAAEVQVANREPASAETWETQAAPWFAALSQTVSGVLRPRHAEILDKHVSQLAAKLGVSSQTSEDRRAEDAESAVAAVLPYQRALDKELSKLDAIKARMAEVRAGDGDTEERGDARLDILSSPPAPPTPAARSHHVSLMDIEEEDGTEAQEAEEMEVDE
ncbi:cohesin complex subunit [Coemansia umbellata]|uniref:Cohesin complex subunit n=1 Tax=Coemansia umbellata TaxID=1424467 RepID=A0ABQ8PIM7_9FUNG|nr:cohesin complex subunit [Coemansia umbellata]